MGKPKQQVISRFFAPKSSSQNPPPSSSSPPRTLSKLLPKISATVSFSPSKRLPTLTPSSSPPPRKPKPSPSPLPPPTPPSTKKFLSKLLEPPSCFPSPSSTPQSLPPNPKYTPLEQQVLELKSKYPDVLLMIEVGYRYRFFGDDAENAARVLGIFAHVDRNFLTASVPTFRLNFHVRRLVGAGYKVGVVKQTETAAIKAHGSNRLAPFSRGLSALYTRSTIEAAEDMGGDGEEGPGAESGNYLVCVVEKEALVGNRSCGIEGSFEVKIGVLAVEISTGEVIHGEFSDNGMRSGLEAVILSLSPAEILLGEPLSMATEKLLLAYAGPSSNVRVERTSRDCFNDGGALAEVMSLYESVGDDTLIAEHDTQVMDMSKEENHHIGIEGIMSMPELAVQALALTIRYLKQFGLERILSSGASFRPFSSTFEMTLSANTLHQLEVLKNNADGSMEGSLFQAMNHTCTAFGSRLFKHWVTHPLCDRNSIAARLDAVSEIAESMGSCRGSQNEIELEGDNLCKVLVQPELDNILSSVLMMLGKSPDIQRGITRIVHRTATASEFIGVIEAVLTSGKQLQNLHVEDDEKIVKSALLRRLICTASSSTIITHAAKLLSCLNKEAAEQRDVLNLFIACGDQFPEVARGRLAVQMEEEKLDSLIYQYRKQLGMRNLEFMSVSGTTHLIELPTDARVPSNWVKVSSTKKTVRYQPPEVLTALDKLLLAKEELAVACRTTWDNFLMGFSKYYAQFRAAVQALAALDCLHSLAILSRNQNYVRPVFVNSDEPSQIHITSGRHPVLESMLGDNFVPNDTNLHEDGEYCQIVTGPNMGGKSCYIRQVALIAIMAQVGSFVPASSAKLHVFDGIYTRMGASDSIQQGRSTFFEELSEASHIVHNCSSHSLVIIDELGRGTSTHDGVAIAYATLHYLLKQKKCMVLFVTHYPKILDIQKEFEGSVGAYHVSYLTSQKPFKITDSKSEFSVGEPDQGEVTFLYKVVCGASDKSFGLNVARLAQLPSSCIARAAIVAAKLEAELSERVGNGAQNIEMPAQNERGRNYSKSTGFSYSEYDRFENFGEVCHNLLSCIKSALDDAEPMNILYALKDARELALKTVSGQPSSDTMEAKGV
uniref:DNA mismatch repair protein n=1 Tax=Elaeis guineensis var. tenera TaxID=51953 RepID=A0A6I9RYQ7_ELAGV|nr:LOW QUALITY PROTEIN: DNA mismatch repair protein MSH3 [Elaeis guineensis]